ncbi:MAG: hypothetical protein IJX60_03165 [Paludibacteraceae bacterium]|nr:hypothetical protein [Paludibacteraceae bacterium]
MKEQDKQAPTVVNNFHAPIGQYVQYQHIEHMTIGSDGQVHVASSSQPTPQPQHIEEAEIVPDVKIPSFFRTNAQSITKIQAKWQEALGNTTKTAVIRFVKSHDYTDGYFKLAGTYEQLAAAFNEAQDKFIFTANDFENANKPLKK